MWFSDENTRTTCYCNSLMKVVHVQIGKYYLTVVLTTILLPLKISSIYTRKIRTTIGLATKVPKQYNLVLTNQQIIFVFTI